MEKVRNFIWVLKPSWKGKDPEEAEYEREDDPVNEKGEKKSKVVPVFGGAICIDESGLLLTTITALTRSKNPNIEKAKVIARSYRNYFRDVVLVKHWKKHGLALYQIKKEENEVFEFLDLDEVNNRVELAVLDKVFAFVHTGGNYSFRTGINNFPPPPIPPAFSDYRIFTNIVDETLFPYLNRNLPLIQVSNLGLFMNSGMSGCPVFKMENNEFLGLIALCTGQFSLLIPLSIILQEVRKFFHDSKKRKREDEGADKKKKKRKGGGDGGGQGGGGGWRGGGGQGRGGGGGWQGGGGGGGRGKGGGGGGQGKGGKGGSSHGRGGGGRGGKRGDWRGGKGRGGRVRGGGVVRTAEDAYMSGDIHLFQDDPTNRTLDLTSSPEAEPPTNQGASDAAIFGSTRSVLTVVFQLPYESNLQESVDTIARQYVCSVISSDQRVVMAITPSDFTLTVGPKLSPGSPEALTLVHWICKIYSCPRKEVYSKTQTGGRCNSFMALHCGQQIAQETSGEVAYCLGWQAAVLRIFFLTLSREHRSEWADSSVDADSAAALKANSYAFPGMRATRFSRSQIIMPLDHTMEHEEDNLTNRTLDLTLSLEVGPTTNQGISDATNSGSTRSVLTIAFQLPFGINLQESVATMAHQYVRSVISSVQRVSMAITLSALTPTAGPKLSLVSPEALTLVHLICRSYCCHMGTELLQHLPLLIEQY